MSPTVALLRAISLLALASPMFIGKRRPGPEDRLMPDKTVRARLAVFANFGAFGLFFPALFVFAGSTRAPGRWLWESWVCDRRDGLCHRVEITFRVGGRMEPPAEGG